MSEMSILSNQYERLVSTTNNVNDSVILLKKKRFFEDSSHIKNRIPKIDDKEKDLSNAKSSLINFLGSLLELLKDGTNTSEYVPNLVIEDYKNRIRQIPYIENDIERTVNLIKNNERLPNESFELLDNISSVLDSERTTLFRKLRTARG